ncbi:peptidoglycan-binding domain-containing protein [Streptomyces gilvifuscus]|uniref:peptidoglycan-binding domain-containing protein n=1 Tax=Streptomyces gilvifuscus TaxID=1550617 RepID=UPI003A8D70A0
MPHRGRLPWPAAEPGSLRPGSPLLDGLVSRCSPRRHSTVAATTRAGALPILDRYGSTITEDGIFGPATRDTLKYAQRQAATQDDGVYGPDTRRAIKHRPSSWPYGCQRVR